MRGLRAAKPLLVGTPRGPRAASSPVPFQDTPWHNANDQSNQRREHFSKWVDMISEATLAAARISGMKNLQTGVANAS